MKNGQEIGKTLKLILERLKNVENVESVNFCNNCKYCHAQEAYDWNRGMFYCSHKWCDIDRKLMDSWIDGKGLRSNCEYFEVGDMKINRLTQKEKKRMGLCTTNK